MKLELPGALKTFAGTAYSVAGQGTPVVFIHGVGMRQQVWAPQAQALAREFQVITYDMLGHGQSQVPPEGVQLVDYAQQLRDLLDHLGLTRVHVVGHSMGALVALEFGLTHPERCLRLAALNAVFCRTPEQSAAVRQRAQDLGMTGLQATLDATLARWFDPDTADETLQQMSAQIRSFLSEVHLEGYQRTYALFARSDRAHETRLKDLPMPALFMTGQYDANSQPAMSEAMAARAPHARADILSGARHMMTLTHADDVNRRLHAFLGSPSPIPT
jgi:pimeloyl-ACP methyl ester carboxylesterase